MAQSVQICYFNQKIKQQTNNHKKQKNRKFYPTVFALFYSNMCILYVFSMLGWFELILVVQYLIAVRHRPQADLPLYAARRCCVRREDIGCHGREMPAK